MGGTRAAWPLSCHCDRGPRHAEWTAAAAHSRRSGTGDDGVERERHRHPARKVRLAGWLDELQVKILEVKTCLRMLRLHRDMSGPCVNNMPTRNKSSTKWGD